MNVHSRRCGSALLLALGIGCYAPDPAHVVRGPLPIRNQHPVALTFLHLRPRRARVQPQGTATLAVDLAYASIFEDAAEPRQRVFFDGETARAAARLRYGVAPALDLEVEVAALYATSGFLDGFVGDFHDVTGLPDSGRRDSPPDQFRMRLRRNGQLIYDLEEDRVGFADVPLVATWQVRVEDEHGPAVAVRAGIELPTGSEDRGYGNGGLDFGGGVLFERSLGRWTVSGAVDLLVPDNPDAWDDAGVDVNNIVQLQAGAEYRLNDRVSLLVQVVHTSDMTDDFDVEEFNREILDLGLGAAWDAPGGAQIYAAFEEDLVSATGPDFGVILGVRWGF